MADVLWEEPPSPDKRRRLREKYGYFWEALRENPGQWARWPGSVRSAHSCTREQRRRDTKGQYECTTSKYDDGETYAWIRYLGPKVERTERPPREVPQRSRAKAPNVSAAYRANPNAPHVRASVRAALAAGCTEQEIADAMSVSVHEVKRLAAPEPRQRPGLRVVPDALGSLAVELDKTLGGIRGTQ